MPILKVKNKTTGLWEDIPYIKGEKGDKGDTGERGPQGIQGEQGIQGIQGDQGIPGVQGPIGLTGPQGVQGEKGDKGDTGAVPIFTVGSTTTLPPGSAPSINIDSTDPENPVMEIGIPKGDTGAKGDKGDKGDTGSVGPAPIFTVGTTSSLPPDSAPVITIDSSDPAHPVMDFGIPAGAKGDTGNTGPAGQDGADGADGQDGISPTITVTEITGGHEVAVTDAEGTQTFDVLDGEVSEQDLEDALIDKADVITSSSSGEIVTISDGGKDMPVVDLSVSLLPAQDLHGQDAPYPPGGGKNKADYPGMITAGAVEQTDGSLYVATANSFYDKVIFQNDGTAGQFSLTFIVKNDGTSRGLYPVIVYTDSTSESMSVNRGYESFTTFTKVSNASKTVDKIMFNYGTGSVKTWFYVQVESGNVPSSWTPYSNVCPISGWTGVGVYHSDADTSNPTTIPIDWSSTAGTVYGGSLDVTRGKLVVDYKLEMLTLLSGAWGATTNGYAVYKQLSSYDRSGADVSYMRSNYFAYSSNGYSTMPLYSYGGSTGANNTFTFILPSTVTSLEEANAWLANLDTPVQFMGKLAIPIEYQLTPTQIETLLGVNNFWSNGNGQIDLEYRCDTKLYIEQLTKPTEDDMTANANIASGKFFMIGNRLMLSTTAISQGETIVVGTNCSEVSLADALNQINA